MKKTSFLILLIAVSCTKQPVFSEAEGKRVAERCIETSQAPGVYSISPGRVASSNSDDNIPNARAVVKLGGTRAGADAINACIRQAAARVG
jgi:hypothetical protein